MRALLLFIVFACAGCSQIGPPLLAVLPKLPEAFIDESGPYGKRLDKMPHYITDDLPPLKGWPKRAGNHDAHEHRACKHPRTWHHGRWVYFYKERWEYQRLGRWYIYPTRAPDLTIPKYGRGAGATSSVK